MDQHDRDHPITVIAICGSLRPGSLTRQALGVALQGAHEAGALSSLVDLRDSDLVFCNGGREYPPAVGRLRQTIRQADGIILGTPEYHGSLSGVLKNALDLMGFEEFEGKMVGLVGVSAGLLGAASALDSLRGIGRALHAWVIPEQVSIPQASRYFDREGQLQDADLQQRLMKVGRQVARFAFLHSSRQIQEFVAAWQSAPENPGG